jgi:hypothetical protein
MQLSAADVGRISKLKGRNQILLYLAAHTRSQWWATVQELSSISGVPQRRAELELNALASNGVLQRKGHGQGTLARFRVVPRTIEVIEPERSDRSNQIDRSDRTRTIRSIEPERSDRSFPSSMDARARARSGSSDLDRSSMEQRVRPSGEVVGGNPGADGRTDVGGEGAPAELRNALVQRVVERWRLPPRVVTPGLMRLLNERATEQELQAFLADAERGTHPAFDGVGDENRFGRSCTAQRFAVWRKSREPRRAVVPREDREVLAPREERLSPAEVEAFAELAKLEMARGRRR